MTEHGALTGWRSRREGTGLAQLSMDETRGPGEKKRKTVDLFDGEESPGGVVQSHRGSDKLPPTMSPRHWLPASPRGPPPIRSPSKRHRPRCAQLGPRTRLLVRVAGAGSHQNSAGLALQYWGGLASAGASAPPGARSWRSPRTQWCGKPTIVGAPTATASFGASSFRRYETALRLCVPSIHHRPKKLTDQERGLGLEVARSATRRRPVSYYGPWTCDLSSQTGCILAVLPVWDIDVAGQVGNGSSTQAKEVAAS